MDDDKINVCMISLNYYPNFSGPDLQAHRVNRSLNNSNINIFVVTRNLGSRENSLDEVIIYRLPRKRVLKKDSRSSLIIWILSVIYYLIKNRKKYQIVHLLSGYTYSAIFTLIAGCLLRKQIVVKNSLARGAFFKNSIRKKINLTVFKKYAHVISISSETRDELINANFREGRTVFIPNGIELNRFSPVKFEEKNKIKKKLFLDKTKKYGIFVGGLNERKGIDLLTESIKYIIDKIPNFQLLLLGNFSNISFKKRIFHILEKNNIKEYVIFLGRRENVSDFLKASDIFLFPSLREGLPNSLLEAMATSLPAVCFSIGGVTDIVVNDFNGILINNKLRDPKKLATIIVSLLKDKEKIDYLAKNAMLSIKEKYNIIEIANKYKKLYIALASKKEYL